MRGLPKISLKLAGDSQIASGAKPSRGAVKEAEQYKHQANLYNRMIMHAERRLESGIKKEFNLRALGNYKKTRI